MKYEDANGRVERCVVAPHAGAWIEINRMECGAFDLTVAPHAGAWIEMSLS